MQISPQFIRCQPEHSQKVKSKVLLFIIERWARSWSQCTGSQPAGDFLSHPGGRLPLLSSGPAVTFQAEERHCSSTSTKLYCLLTEAHRCEELVQGCYVALSRWVSNPRPIDRKSNALPLRFIHNGANKKRWHSVGWFRESNFVTSDIYRTCLLYTSPSPRD